MEARKQTQETLRDAIHRLLRLDRAAVAVLAEHLDWQSDEIKRQAQDRTEEVEALRDQADQLTERLNTLRDEHKRTATMLTETTEALRQANAELRNRCVPDAEPARPCRTCGVPLTPDHTLATGHQESI